MKKLTVLTAAAAIVFVIFSGCQTPGDTGFPLIDIVDAEIDIADDSQFADASKAKSDSAPSADTKIIGGTKDVKIVPKDITITLIDTSIQAPIRNGEDVTKWFLNIPKGLTATAHAADPKAKYAADKGATEIIVTIEGIPKEIINAPIKIRVPYEVTNRSWDFDIPPSEYRRFEVYGLGISSVVVDGAISREIDPKTLMIKMGGTKLASTLAMDTDISSWFVNLPRGLKAVVAEETVPISEEVKTEAKKEQQQQSLMITISGTPAIQLKENMIVRIPANVTVANMVLDIPPSEEARYDIGSYTSSVADNYELRTGSNWRGVIDEWGLTGPEVYKSKDFTAVGIIQISTESVYAIGADGEYHWTGDTISYGDLMAEAKKLNAHAIIDVVIDSKDSVSKTEERRHVEANHKPTPLELSKINQRLIRAEPDPNGGFIYVEKIEVTRRTWTGTALAIQYAPAHDPVVGSQGGGYIPSVPVVPAAAPSR